MTEKFWYDLFIKCGVEPKHAAAWAPIWAVEVVPEAFSMGGDEIDNFTGHVLHESKLLSRLEEDLYYKTPGRLMKVWPSRFKTLADEVPYLKSPEALANRVYGGRMGNVNPGDGWRNRGSGLMQVTGADNLRELQRLTGIPVFDQPELLRQVTPEAIRVCVRWWEGNVPDAIMGNVSKETFKVNGGQAGLSERGHLSAIVAQEMQHA